MTSKIILLATLLLSLGACVGTGNEAADAVIRTIPSLVIWSL